MPAAALARRSDGDLPHKIPGLKQWLDARRPRNYDCLHLPGSAGYYASTPDSAALSITGDIDIRVKVALADWTPVADASLVSKYVTSTANRSYSLRVTLTTGVLTLYTSPDGVTGYAVDSSVTTGIADGSTKWVRATRRVSDGRVQFFLSDDGSSWAQLGTDRTLRSGEATFDSTALLEVGALNTGAGSAAAGRFYRAQVRNNVLDNGSGIVFDADFTNKGYTFTEDSSNHATVTCNGRAPLADGDSLSMWADLSGNAYDMVQATAAKKPVYRTATTTGYLTLPGVAGNYASTPDSAAISVTGDIDIRVKALLADWSPAATTYLFTKWSGTFTFRLSIATNGTITLNWMEPAATSRSAQSSAAVPFSDGTAGWVRATLRVNNGTQSETKFWTSTDGSAWTQLGVTRTGSTGPTSLVDSSAPLVVGADLGNALYSAGQFYRAQVRSNILDDGTGIVFDADFTATGRSFTESSSNAAVVTVNGDQARESVSTRPSIIFDGVDDVLSAVFTQAQPLTVYVAFIPGITGTTQTWVGGVANNWTGVTASAYKAYGGTELTTGTPTTAPHVVSAVYNSASSTISVDGAAAAGDAGTNGLTSLNIGALNAASQFAQGAFQSVLVYAGAHSDNTRKKIERWLGRRSSVAITQ